MKVQELKIVEAEDQILMYNVSKIQPEIRYIMGDMTPPSYGFILFQNSSLNRTLGDNCYSLGYRGPNRIPKDVPERAQTVISMVRSSDSEDEPVTRGIPYHFVVLNSSVTGHLGKRIINPKW